MINIYVTAYSGNQQHNFLIKNILLGEMGIGFKMGLKMVQFCHKVSVKM